MFRRNTGIYGNSLYKIFQFFIGKFINLRTFTCFRLIFQNTDSFRNRRSRHFMISRDHNRTNTRLLTFRYSSFGFFTRRIHHCDQADKRKIIFVFQSQFQLVWHCFICKSKNTESLSWKCLILFFDIFSVLLRHRTHFRTDLYLIHTSQQHIDRTFYDHRRNIFNRMLCWH